MSRSDVYGEFKDWLEHPERYPDDFISIPIDIIPSVLTPERTRLIAELQRNGPADSVQDLAKRLDRNYASVSRDVSYLSVDFLTMEQGGHRKRVAASGRPVIVTGAARAELASTPGG